MLDPSDRSGLIEIAARLAPTPACRRAFVSGHVEVLGGFKVPHPCWILRVTSRHGTEWLLLVSPDDLTHGYTVGLMSSSVPWDLWVGLRVSAPGYSIYRGDHPLLYEQLWRSQHDPGNQDDTDRVR